MNDRLMERRTLDVRGIQVRDAEDGDGSILTGSPCCRLIFTLSREPKSVSGSNTSA